MAEITNDTFVNIDKLAASMRGELDSLPVLSSKCCIYAVPKRLHHLNEKAYTPQLVSIGPLHHGKPELRPMEEHKKRYLQDFLQRTELSLVDCLKVIEKNEKKLRDCYAETIEFSSDEFIKMILVDAAFIIEVLLRYHFKPMRKEKENDRVYNKPWAIQDIRKDMWLLENQLPFFILEDLFDPARITLPSGQNQMLSITKLAYEFSKDLWDLEEMEEKSQTNKSPEVQHLVDFLWICHQPPQSRSKKKLKTLGIPSATELHQAGVKFKLGSSKNLFDIKFKNGILEIPRLEIVGATELLFRNLLAFEQCHCSKNYINDYVIIINHLVNTAKDVELLVKDGIVENWLWDDEGMSALFHSLVKETFVMVDDFYFSGLVEELNAYCRKPCHKWQATLKQQYFNNPWSIISFIAAVILLVLTTIQAVCSILSV